MNPQIYKNCPIAFAIMGSRSMVEKENIHEEIQFKAEWHKCLNMEKAVS